MEWAYLTENAHRQWMMRNLAATGDQGQDIQRQRRWDEIRGRSPNNIKRREGPSGAEATSSSRTQRERHRTRGEERDGNGERKGTRQTRTGQWKTEWKELDRVGRPRRGNVTCPCPSAYSCLLSLVSFLFLFLSLFLSVSVIDLSTSFTPFYYYYYCYPSAIPYRCGGPPAVANLPMAPCLDGVDSCLDCES